MRPQAAACCSARHRPRIIPSLLLLGALCLVIYLALPGQPGLPRAIPPAPSPSPPHSPTPTTPPLPPSPPPSPSFNNEWAWEERYKIDYSAFGKTKGTDTLVFGTALRYRWSECRSFVISLRATGYKGDIVILLDREAAEEHDFLAKLEHYRVEYHFVTEDFPFFDEHLDPEITRVVKERSLPRLVAHLDLTRFYMPKMYMEAYGHRYAYVLLSDIRDVAFQKDPFDWSEYRSASETRDALVLQDKLYVTEESRDYTIATHPWNNYATLRSLGLNYLSAMRYRYIICSGTTLGSNRMIQIYLQNMLLFMFELAHLYTSTAEFIWSVYTNQPMHDHIVYAMAEGKWKDDVVIFEVGHSPIISLAITQEGQYITDNHTKVVNVDGTLVNVVHQYDRQLPLWNYWTTMYANIDKKQ